MRRLETERLILRPYVQEDLDGFYACVSDPEVVRYEPYRPMSPDEARQVLARPPAGLVVLDIRTPEEFRDGHLPGARNLDFFAPDFRQQLEALAREDVPILLYCRSGNRSGQAMRLLRQWGRDDVLHLADGFRSWRAAGLPEE